MGGRIMIIINLQGEICVVQKGGGVGVFVSEVMRCFCIVVVKVQLMIEIFKKVVSY